MKARTRGMPFMRPVCTFSANPDDNYGGAAGALPLRWARVLAQTPAAGSPLLAD